MKKLALIMATILGIIPSILTCSSSPAFARNHHSGAEDQYSQPVKPVAKNSLIQSQVLEINFTIRTFLWALDNKKHKILAKIAAPQMLADFPNAKMMLLTMERVHGPVIGARHVFIHLPTINNEIAIQAVYLQDINGKSWKATYMLKHNEKKRYGVFGCILEKLPGKFS